MTPEERLARLEARADETEKWLEKIDAKVDQLLETTALGKGAWIAILKVGGAITGVIALAAAIVALVKEIRHL